MGRHLLRPTRRDDLAALVPALRPQVDDPVGGLDDLQVVLDYDDDVADIGQAMQDIQELADIVEVQPGGRLVQDVQGPAGAPFAEFPRELDPLRLPARERGSRLAQFEVAQAHLGQETEPFLQLLFDAAGRSHDDFRWAGRGGAG